MKTATWLVHLALFAAAFSARASDPKPRPSSPTDSTASLAVLVRPANAASKPIAAEYARNVTHLLGGIDRLRLAPRSRVLHAEATDTPGTAVGREIAVDHLLSATVRFSTDAIEIAAELIDCAAGTKRWQHTYRSSTARGSSLSAEIARDVRAALPFESATRARSETDVVSGNPPAWEHYLRGRQALETLTEPSLVEAVAHFERAVAADANFMVAQVGLATAHIALGYNFQKPRAHFEAARRILAPPLRRDAPLVEAVVDDAVLKYYLDWDWSAAARGAEFTTRHDPAAVETHACFLHCAQTMGHLDEGRQQIALAQRANPDSPALRGELPCATYYAGKFADAERESRGALKSDPDNPLLYWSLARALAQQGRFDDALAGLKTAQSKTGGDWTGILSEIAYIHGRQNRSDAARETISQLRAREKSEYVDHYLYAMAFAGLGDAAEVFRHLEQAAADRSTWIPSLPTDPKFATLHSDSRFRAMLTALKLPVR